jgi:hypothetical protein
LTVAIMAARFRRGEMTEWPKVPDSKAAPSPSNPAGSENHASDAQRRRDPSEALGQSRGNEPTLDVVEAALADALTRAAAAEQWTTVEALSRELQARREARSNVVVLDTTKRRRG